ncbi:MAG: hypothetical protein MZV70_12515 [Desulfobacterales bacterium]|nr:hypothetical protein [Desulfobacterales bacterium]
MSRLGIDRSSLRKMRRMLSGAGIDTIRSGKRLSCSLPRSSPPRGSLLRSAFPTIRITRPDTSRPAPWDTRRIPLCQRKMGSPRGGRVLFIAEDSDVEKLVSLSRARARPDGLLMATIVSLQYAFRKGGAYAPKTLMRRHL